MYLIYTNEWPESLLISQKSKPILNSQINLSNKQLKEFICDCRRGNFYNNFIIIGLG